MTDIIRIDFDKGVLNTPEHTYYIAQTLSVDRYIEFELLQAAAAYGVTFNDIAKAWDKIEDALNKVKFVEAAAIISNMKNALREGAKKENHIVLRVCALFLNEKDEDVRTYRAEVIDAKIKDWLASGVCYEDFFSLTVSLVPGLLTAFERTFTDILSKMKTQNQQEESNTSATDKETSEDFGQ